MNSTKKHLPEGLEGVIESITKLILHDIQRRWNDFLEKSFKDYLSSRIKSHFENDLHKIKCIVMKERIPKSKTKQKNLPQTMFCKNFPYSSNSCSNFRKHMINVHEKRRDYKCNTCGRSFGQKVDLKTPCWYKISECAGCGFLLWGKVEVWKPPVDKNW